MKKSQLIILLSICCSLFLKAQELKLHVPSPEWQDQIIYFLMIDRFNDGDTTNNNQGMNEYDPADFRKFSGGDIQGVIKKLDYIKNLGATTVWVTPPVANQWWDSSIQYGGYHGYWAENFKKVDVHFGTLADYQLLSHQLHKNGMYLIQDIVANHTGNFFRYEGKFDPNNITANYKKMTASTPINTPTQYPFNLNDPNNPEHRNAGIYHWTPEISNYEDPVQKLSYQMADLDDINTNNMVVREVIRDSYGYWIHVVGVDGFRIDTIIYVELDFWPDFMNSDSKTAPGINQVAKKTGRDNFISFGETFIKSKPMQADGDKEVATYQGTKEKPALNSMLNYPLYYSIKEVFSQGLPTQYLGYRLNTYVNGGIYKDPYIMANFVDNHDWSRFIRNSKPVALKQALALLFTIPGIPVIYQGTEQLFTETRTSMFAGGWDSKGKDHFDENAEMYLFIKNLAKLRNENKVFTRGDLKIINDSELGSGVLAYSRSYQGKQAFIIFNTAEYPILTGNLALNLASGIELSLVSGMYLSQNLVVGNEGVVNFEMPARSCGIYLVADKKQATKSPSLKINLTTKLQVLPYEKDFIVEGKVFDKEKRYELIIDGDIAQKMAIQPDKKGRWKLNIPISRFKFGVSTHKLFLFSPAENLASSSFRFATDVKIQGTNTEIIDPEHDDFGLEGKYKKPTDKGYQGQMDITNVKTVNFGGNLLVEIFTSDISDVWLPSNGFDHASFHVFIDVPAKKGNCILPKLNTNTPPNFDWDYMFYMAGWSKALYSNENADSENLGTILTPTPSISVDKKEKKITVQFSPDALGNLPDLKGLKLYITTWDSTGSEDGYRSITQDGGSYDFGGDGSAKPVLILDDTQLIEIK